MGRAGGVEYGKLGAAEDEDEDENEDEDKDDDNDDDVTCPVRETLPPRHPILTAICFAPGKLHSKTAVNIRLLRNRHENRPGDTIGSFETTRAQETRLQGDQLAARGSRCESLAIACPFRR